MTNVPGGGPFRVRSRTSHHLWRLLGLHRPFRSLLSVALRPAHSRCHQSKASATSLPLHDCSDGFRLERCRVGLAPTGKRRLCTAHVSSGHAKRRTPIEVTLSQWLKPLYHPVQLSKLHSVAANELSPTCRLSLWTGMALSVIALVGSGCWIVGPIVLAAVAMVCTYGAPARLG